MENELGIVVIARSPSLIERIQHVLSALQGPALTARFVEPIEESAASASRDPAALAPLRKRLRGCARLCTLVMLGA
jgi:hypothetical protein